jgi:hypothetical protein
MVMKFQVPLEFLDWLIKFCYTELGAVKPNINIIQINFKKSNLLPNEDLLEKYANIAKYDENI